MPSSRRAPTGWRPTRAPSRAGPGGARGLRALGNGYARSAAAEPCLLVAQISSDASAFELWGALLHGSRLVLFPPEGPSPAAGAEVIARHGVTTARMTTAVFHE